jgi:hypothetical protein
MKSKISLILSTIGLLAISFSLGSCGRFECLDTDLDQKIEANVYAWGTLKVTDAWGNDVTANYTNTLVRAVFYKQYCIGNGSADYAYSYNPLPSGELDKREMGNYSFDMTNTADEVHFRIEIPLEDGNIGRPLYKGIEKSTYEDWQDGKIRAQIFLEFQENASGVVDWSSVGCNNCRIVFIN